jgi:septal ring factor EnvC (AmiA/AmiB activator)
VFFSYAQVDPTTASQDQLKSEMAELERQIAEHQALIVQKQQQGKSLERDITILDTKIAKSAAEIKLREKVIGGISKNITEKTQNINSLDQKLGRERIVMQTVLREMDRSPQNSLTLVTLGNASISSVLDTVSKFSDLKNSLNNSMGIVKNTKGELVQVKEQLIENKTEEQQLKDQQLSIKKDIESNKTENGER